jgi:hypothetical protein
MPIITKPNISKGQAAVFSLSKSQLLQHPTVVADSYFSNSANWYRVNAVYKSSEGSQYEIVEFDAAPATPTGSFLVSTQARDSFIIQKLVILDFDGGFLEIPRSQLTVVDFDISFIQAFFTIDFSQNISSLSPNPVNGASISNGKLNLLSAGGCGFTLPNSPFPASGNPLYTIRVWIDLEHNALVQSSGASFALQANKLAYIPFDVSEEKRARGYVYTISPLGLEFWFNRLMSISTSVGNFKITKIEFFEA